MVGSFSNLVLHVFLIIFILHQVQSLAKPLFIRSFQLLSRTPDLVKQAEQARAAKAARAAAAAASPPQTSSADTSAARKRATTSTGGANNQLPQIADQG